jgi:hypothetical protein
MNKKDRQKHYWLVEYLGYVFENINKNLCSNCPRANFRYASNARFRGDFCSKETGCCTNCARTDGYFKDWDEDFNDKKYKQLKKEFKFDKENGFFDIVNHECKLPREKRSICCLCYICYHIEDKYKINQSSMENIRDILRLIREKNKMLI